MKLTIRQASPERLAEIGGWRYEPPYDSYDGDQEPVLNPERFYAAVGEDGALVGFYYLRVRPRVGFRPAWPTSSSFQTWARA